MMRLIAVLLTCGLVIASGIVHGFWTDRWVEPVEPAVAATRQQTLPLLLGDWEGEDLPERGKGPEQVSGCLQRRYVNQKTGQAVTIALVCGRPGPVSIHTPEACYGGSGYIVGTRTRSPAPDDAGEFWTADALRTRATEETRLRLFWGWSGGDGWKAPEAPRLDFASYPVLFKLYVIRELANPGEPLRDDPCLGFMQVFLPALDAVLWPQAS